MYLSRSARMHIENNFEAAECDIGWAFRSDGGAWAICLGMNTTKTKKMKVSVLCSYIYRENWYQ